MIVPIDSVVIRERHCALCPDRIYQSIQADKKPAVTLVEHGRERQEKQEQNQSEENSMNKR